MRIIIAYIVDARFTKSSFVKKKTIRKRVMLKCKKAERMSQESHIVKWREKMTILTKKSNSKAEKMHLVSDPSNLSKLLSKFEN